MGYSRASDMGEDPLAFFHDGQPGEAGRRNISRARELGGTADGGRFKGIFPNQEKDGQFFVAQAFPAAGRVVLRGGLVMGASPINGQGDKIAHITKTQAPRLAEQR